MSALKEEIEKEKEKKERTFRGTGRGCGGRAVTGGHGNGPVTMM